ncbi:hypothetical protein KBA41_12360 [Candidatus Ozemobacteraceae bacterium]|nr:hypothetical protein [Candidatus Ozemobacteraceae bacterium]
MRTILKHAAALALPSLLLILASVSSAGETPVTPDRIRAMTASFTRDSVPELLSVLHASDPRCREEALITLQSLPLLPPWEEAPLVEAVIDALADASETVRFQAVKTLATRFPRNRRAQEGISIVATSSVPIDLLSWAQDTMFADSRESIEARSRLQRIASEADARLRSYLREQPLLESASRTREWLLKEPAVQAVDLTRDCLWFSTRDGLESGLLLDAYRSLATQSASASAPVPPRRFPVSSD